MYCHTKSPGGGMQRWRTQYNRTTPHTYSLTENGPLPSREHNWGVRDPSTLHGCPTVAAHAKHGGPSCAKGEARHSSGLSLALALPPRITIQAFLPELAEACHTPTTPDADQHCLPWTHATSVDSCSQLPNSDTQPQQTPTQLVQYPPPPDLVPHTMNHPQCDPPRTFTETNIK